MFPKRDATHEQQLESLLQNWDEPWGGRVNGRTMHQFLARWSLYISRHCAPSMDDAVKAVFTEYTRRMREAGVKFQTVVYRMANADAGRCIRGEQGGAELEQGLCVLDTSAGFRRHCAVSFRIPTRTAYTMVNSRWM